MADNNLQGLRENPETQFELEQTDDYSQYLLFSKTEILAVLRSLIQKGAMVSVYFDHGKSFFLTTVLALAPDNNQFIVDIGSNDEMNSKALQANHLIFTTQVDKVKVQFSLDRLTTTRSEGRPAFLAAIPEKLLRLQRRDFFRLSTPIAEPVRLHTTIAREGQEPRHIEAPLLDISGGGVGLMVNLDQAELFEMGERLDNCKIMLPNEGLLATTLSVRNRFEVTTRSGSRHMRIGCQYIDLPPARLTVIQRYITRIERERKARLNGLG